MVSVKFKLIGGLGDSVGHHGPEYCSSVLNWYCNSGSLKKRRGMTPYRVCPASETTSGVYVSQSDGSDPSVATAQGSLPLSIVSGTTTVFIAADAPFNRFKMTGVPAWDKVAAYDMTRLASRPLTIGCDFYIHNGTTWVQVYPGNAFFGYYNSASDVSNVAPWITFSGSASGVAGTLATQLECVFEPPTSWGLKTFGGQSKYWMKVVTPATGASFSGAETITTASVCTTENRVMNILQWQDRLGTPHDLVVSMYSDDGKQLRYMMDGVTLSQSADLQPDGVARVFGPDQQVFTAYHGASDRVIGYIQNYGWFYVIPGVPSVFALPADDVGTDTAYQSVFGGLRSFLPESNFILVADSRVFSFKDQTISWSAFGPFIDVWPNASEIFLDDGLGPITGAAVVQGSIIVFKRRAIYAVQQNGKDVGDVEYDAVPLSTNMGAIGGICPAGDVLYFVGEDGFYRFDGKQAVRLSDKFDEEFLSGDIGMDFSKTKAAYYSPLAQVRFFFPFESSNILDRAVYINAGGEITPGAEASEPPQTVYSLWPQGRVDPTQPGEYGFQGTAVSAGFTTPQPRILLGDRYGFVWEMDSGYGDAGYQVVAEAYQSDQNYAGNDKILVGPVYVSQNGRVTQNPLSVGVMPNTQKSEAKMINAYPYEVGMQRGVSFYANPQATCRQSQTGVTKRLNSNVRCHSFGVYLRDATVGVREITGFDVEAIPVGNRGF